LGWPCPCAKRDGWRGQLRDLVGDVGTEGVARRVAYLSSTPWSRQFRFSEQTGGCAAIDSSPGALVAGSALALRCVPVHLQNPDCRGVVESTYWWDGNNEGVPSGKRPGGCLLNFCHRRGMVGRQDLDGVSFANVAKMTHPHRLP
jgi:hypothetical protein